MTPVLLVGLDAVVAGLLSLVSRRVVAALPEPQLDESVEGESAKPLYADLAARRGVGLVLGAASAVVAAVAAWVLGEDLWLVAVVPLVPVCVVLAWVDWHTRLLPSRLVLPATAYALLVALVLWPVSGSYDDLVRAVLGLVAARSFFWVLWFVHSAGMGFGDVRLAALVGALLGHVGWSELVVGLYAGFLVFGLPGLLLALVRWDRALLRTAFPYGPFLLLGALVGLLVGPWVEARLGWG